MHCFIVIPSMSNCLLASCIYYDYILITFITNFGFSLDGREEDISTCGCGMSIMKIKCT